MEIVKLQMCRICLAENVCMYVVATKTLQALYEKLTDIPFVTEDGRPMLACSFCCTKLKQCHQLQRKCLEAEELFAQMLNEDDETQPLIKHGLLEFSNGFIVTPTVHINIIDKCGPGTNDIEELPDDCGAQDVTEIKEEQQSDLEDTNYCKSEDIPQQYSESDSEGDVPLMKFKSEVEDDEGVSIEKMTEDYDDPTIHQPALGTAPGATAPQLYVRITKLEDTIIKTQQKNTKLDSKNIQDTQIRSSTPDTKLEKSFTHSKARSNSINNTAKAAKSRKKKSERDVTGQICIDTVIDSDNLKKPLKLCMNEKPYKCEVCKSRFSYKKTIALHMRLVHGEQNSFECNQCPRSFKYKRSFLQHIRVHNGEKPFKCDICHRKYASKKTLSIHNRIHTGESYQCDLCQRSFAYKNSLINHIQGHYGQKPFQCDVCGYSFAIKSSLLLHILQHTGEKPYKCEKCKRSFNQRFKLKHHLRQHTDGKPFKCEVCEARFTLKKSLRRHFRIHIDDSKPHKCEICQRSFSVSTNLKRHIRTHTGEKPFQCKMCQRSFNESNRLVNHMRLHSGEKPFKCHLCEESYCARSSLSRHIRLHAGKKPHKCEVCERHFTYTSDLKRHVQTHSGVRPFECNTCQKSFTQKSSLNAHIRKTHETKS